MASALYITLLKGVSKQDTVWRETLANLANHSWFAKLKLSKLVLIINNLLADLLIHQTFFRQMLETSQLANIFPCQSFPPYGSYGMLWYKSLNKAPVDQLLRTQGDRWMISLMSTRNKKHRYGNEVATSAAWSQ